MKKIKLFTNPTCGKCHVLKLMLIARNIPFDEVEKASENPQLIEKFLDLGIREFPIIEVEDSGFMNFQNFMKSEVFRT